MFSRKVILFGDSFGTVTAKIISPKIQGAKLRELYIELQIRDKNFQWNKIGNIPICSWLDAKRSVDSCIAQISKELLRE